MGEPLASTARPRLWRLARLDFDSVRNRPVLLYPEGAMLLNDSGAEILALCDGTRTVGEISGALGAKYHADVASDVALYLSQLVERELVQDLEATPAAPESERPEAARAD